MYETHFNELLKKVSKAIRIWLRGIPVAKLVPSEDAEPKDPNSWFAKSDREQAWEISRSASESMKGNAAKRFVLDASGMLAWCPPEEGTIRTEAILDSLANGAEAITPAICPSEPANALLVGERRKRVSMAQVRSVLRRIGALPISVDPARVDHAFEQVLWFARQQQLTEYDAAYLKLALRARASPLATLDNRLKRAARNAGIAVVKI